MSVHNGMAFSTKDRDLDNSAAHCAIHNRGAFWYNACYEFHPNGLYMPGARDHTAMIFRHWPDSRVAYQGLKATRMAIRPL